MKKFYPLLLLAVISLFSFGAAAKTLTLKATADGAVYYVDMASGDVIPITTDGVDVTFENEGTLVIRANTGWLISSLSGTVTFDYGNEPTDDTSTRGAVTYPLADGSTLTVNVIEASSYSEPTIVLRGEADAYYASYNYESLYPDANGEITITGLGNSLSIFAKDGYKLVNAMTDTGMTFSPQGAYISIYTGQFSSGTTVISVESVSLSDVESGTFTAEVIGAEYKCYFSDSNYNYYYFNSKSQTISFSEGDTFSLKSNYGALYKVELNGETVATSWTTYNYTPKSGDKIVITTDFPDVDVDFSVAFAEGCDAGIIKEFRYEYNLLDASVWNSGTWSPKFGKTLNLTLNTADYDNVAVSVNGAPVTVNYGGSVSITLDNEVCRLEISGTRLSGYNATIIVSDPEHVTVYKGYSSQNVILPLEGEVTEVELTRAEGGSGLQFVTAEGYRIVSLTVTPEPATEIYNNMVYVSADETLIEVEIEEIIRDKAVSVFVGPGKWNYGPQLSLGNSDNEFRREIICPEGYSIINYCDDDITKGISLSAYPSPILYINGIESFAEYGNYSGLSSISDGDVLKIFQSTPAAHTLSYEIDSRVNVTVMHDRMQTIEYPGSHTVLAGTEVSIIPIEVYSNEAASSSVIVKVNDENIAPVNGVYTFNVNGNTSVKVEPSIPNGIEDVNAADEDAAIIFNLQGVRIDSTPDRLPSGVYIINGRKVRK